MNEEIRTVRVPVKTCNNGQCCHKKCEHFDEFDSEFWCKTFRMKIHQDADRRPQRAMICKQWSD